MTTPSRSLSRLALAAALVLGVSACDSTVDPPPGGQSVYCDATPTAFGCPDSGIEYDTLTAADVNGRTQINVRDFGSGTGSSDNRTVTWAGGTTYVLDGLVFVGPGQTLVIEPGTVVRGRPGSGRNASALIVARGGRIQAEGTATAPIIFTALNDDLTSATDLLDGGAPQSGLWGGLIVLGAAPTNIAVGETVIEGIDANETRGTYGGTNPADDSGTLRYVSIRHGGTLIGDSNEINGLTLGAVGSGTTIDYVEIFANQDDGIEWFGGTVRATHLVVSFAGDDMFDYDLGYNGVNQYVFGLMAEGFGDNGGENDGADVNLGGAAGEGAQPFAIPTFANVTMVGSGLTAANSSRALTIRDNAGAKYYRTIFYGFQNGIHIEDTSSATLDSRARIEAGDIVFDDILFFNTIAQPTTLATAISYNVDNTLSAVPSALLTGSFVFGTDPGLAIARTPGGGLNPVPTNAPMPAGTLPAGLEANAYLGAFGPGGNWLQGWTALSQYGYTAGPAL